MGLRNAELEKCSHCMIGKQTRVSFKKHPPSRKSELLELVHYDVCGPLKVKSFSGALYFVTFIDDCSRKLWVYALQRKDRVPEKFKEFHAMVERQSRKKLKCISSDNGGEYHSMYAMVCTRPNIAHIVGTVSRFLSNPGRQHWNAVKWILRYLHGIINMKLCFGGDKPTLMGYSDSDMAGDIDSRKSTSDYLISLQGELWLGNQDYRGV